MGRVAPATAASRSCVELRLAGTFGVTRDGHELADGEVGSRKSRVLLKLLTVERPGLVPVGRIIDVLWAGDPPAAAEQNVATLVSRLRGALGPGIILGGRQGYRLGGEPGVRVDLDVAARYCDQAEHRLAVADSVARAAAERAIELLSTGTAVADEPYAAWADAARDELHALLRRARLAAAEAAVAMGDPRSALRFAAAAIAADSLDEAAYRWYMSASDAAGEPAKALTAYATLRDRLSAELGLTRRRRRGSCTWQSCASSGLTRRAAVRIRAVPPVLRRPRPPAGTRVGRPGFIAGPRWPAGMPRPRRCWRPGAARPPRIPASS